MTEEIPKETKVRLIPSTRLTLALLVSFALFTQYAQRVSLTMGIVCMVDRTSKTSTTSDLLSFNQTTVKINTKLGSTFLGEKRFPWTELQQQILLGAYWFGYIFTLVPSKCRHSLTFVIVHLSFLFRWLACNQLGSKKTFYIEFIVQFDCDFRYSNDLFYRYFSFLRCTCFSSCDRFYTWSTLSCNVCLMGNVGRTSRTKYTHFNRFL